jgi:hypothetical protein
MEVIAMTLDAKAAAHLAKLLGMCGSAHAGERSAAALKASEFVRGRGLTWHEVVVTRTPARTAHHNSDNDDWRAMREYCMRHSNRLRPREHQFVVSLGEWRGDLTEKQSKWLDAIVARVRKQTGR